MVDYPNYYDDSAMAIAAMLADRDGRLADHDLGEQVAGYHAACGLSPLSRKSSYDEAYGLLLTHGDLFTRKECPFRDHQGAHRLGTWRGGQGPSWSCTRRGGYWSG